MKKSFFTLFFVSTLLISCGGQKSLVSQNQSNQKEDLKKPKKKLGLGSLVSSVMTSTENLSSPSPTSQPVMTSSSVSSGSNREIIETNEIEEPKILQLTSFVTISKILSLKPNQSYNSVVSTIGEPYDILHKDSKGSIYLYYYRTIDSLYNENSENLVGSESEGNRLDGSWNRVYLEFDSSNNLVKIVTNEGFSNTGSVINFNKK